MSAIDLLLRYAIIAVTFQLACAWAHAFQSPWPLPDALQLAPSAKSQLFQSLGIRFDLATTGWCRALLSASAVRHTPLGSLAAKGRQQCDLAQNMWMSFPVLVCPLSLIVDAAGYCGRV
ncbi:hypothetical protein VIN30_00845 [Adlercreutzia sp. R7]|uniref:DUF2752 domain-containing protein n=1 Tax=Adlercreutzia wanghongyangiae TaxID=3111451 RepID=A0ABU6IF27_9ACTN|nr:hypothetical protein [Adlercreutzia sp. R7]